jgi:hypothetical protein
MMSYNIEGCGYLDFELQDLHQHPPLPMWGRIRLMIVLADFLVPALSTAYYGTFQIP